MSFHSELLGQAAFAKNFHQGMLRLDQALLSELCWIHLIAIGIIRFQSGYINNVKLTTEGILETKFGQTAIQGHLAAFESTRAPLTGSSSLTLAATSGRLAKTGAGATSTANAFFTRALSCLQI